MLHAPVNAASLAGSKPLLFVDTGSGGIDVYDVHKLQGGPIKTITRGLVGNQYDMTTDVAGNLYVVADDQGVEQDQYVAVYAPPYTGEPKKLSGVLFPQGVAVDKAGNVYVATCGAHCGSTPAGIYVFAPGASQPMSEITSPLFKSLTSLAADAEGNVYAANYDQTTWGGSVLEVPAGSTAVRDLGLKGIAEAWGVAVDTAGDVFVSSVSGGRAIMGFKPGKTVGSTLIDTFDQLFPPEVLTFGPDGNLYVPFFNSDPSRTGFLLVYHGTKQIGEIVEPGDNVMAAATFPNPIFGGSTR
jgi:hypothetical protein